MLEFRILGPLEVVGDDGPVPLGGPKQRATLAILLLHAGRVVSVDRLADDLYAGAAPVTAVTQVQRQVSELRKALGSASVIETRAPGYALRLSPGQLDLERFENMAEDANRALADGRPARARDLLNEALRLWRGAPLADLTYESFAQTSITRLEELRLATLEQRIEADLMLGRHRELVPELEDLIFEHPLRERLRGQLMLALYRTGRQAEALDVYRRTREALVKEFGIEPMPALRELERAILSQDPSLELDGAPRGPRASTEVRGVLVVSLREEELEPLLGVGEVLARLPGRELIVARLLEDGAELERSAAALNKRREDLGPGTRTAAFTTLEPARDIVRLGTTYDVELVLLSIGRRIEASVSEDIAALLDRSPADVALLMGEPDFASGDGICVPFGGSEHDWAALELGAWLAAASGTRLRLLGTKADQSRRDASRLLADASLAVQRVVGVAAEPMLAEPSEEALTSAVQPATLVVTGMSPRWRQEGVGSMRSTLARTKPTLFVHRGPRPGGLAPRETRTRFTWSIES